MSKSLVVVAMVFLVSLVSGCAKVASPPPLVYPEAQRIAHTDVLHGTPVHDPYRWLETSAGDSNTDVAALSAWLTAQQALSSAYFADISSLSAIRDSLTALWDFERREAPRRFGDSWFFFRNTGSADHYALVMQSDLTAEPVTLIDPGEWADSQRLLAGVSISPDGRFVAWLQTNAQGLERRWRLRDLNGGSSAPELALDWLDVDDIVWRSDSLGFYYSAGVQEPDSSATGIYFHAVRRDDSISQADEIVMVSDNLLRVLASVDGRWLIATEETSTGPVSRGLLLDLERRAGAPVVIGEGASGALRYLGARDGSLFLLSTLDDPAGSVISIDPLSFRARSPTVVVASEAREILRALPVSGGTLVEYLEAGVSVLELVGSGGLRRALPLPGLGRIASLTFGESDDEVLYSFSTLTTPVGVYRLHTSTADTSVLFTPELNFAPDEFVVERLSVPAAAGESISVLIAGKRGALRAGDSSLLLEVYGGFGISMDSGFSTARLGWMAGGGVYAIAAVRGGGESGPQWHAQAIGVNKHRSIEDLVSVADHLHGHGYVAPNRLAVMGASHGAMLVAAAINADPTRFAAAVLSAGPMDMLRLVELGGSASWQEEYGGVTIPEEFSALLGYSPYHNVRPGSVYPALLLLTAEEDEVVAAAHTYKYAARLQAEIEPSRPVLLRTRPGAGHLDTGNVDQLIAQYAERWAFLLNELER